MEKRSQIALGWIIYKMKIPILIISVGSKDMDMFSSHKNHLSAAVLLTDSERTEVLKIDYTPFGKATLTGDIEYNPRLPGQYQDNDFVYYNGYRYYEPETGRYLQPEPIYQNPEMVQAYAVAGYPLNPYAYAVNNPLRFVDPTGYSPIGFVIKLTKKGIKKLHPLFTKKAAVVARKDGKNVLMESQQLAHEVQSAASCGKPIIRHKAHHLPDGSQGLPHYQQNGTMGHTFWGKFSGFIGSIDIGELIWDLVNPFDLLYGELGDGSCGPNGCPLPSKEEFDNVP